MDGPVRLEVSAFRSVWLRIWSSGGAARSLALGTLLGDCLDNARRLTMVPSKTVWLIFCLHEAGHLLLTMSISGGDSAAVRLVRAGFAVVLLLVSVSGFWPVLAPE